MRQFIIPFFLLFFLLSQKGNTEQNTFSSKSNDNLLPNLGANFPLKFDLPSDFILLNSSQKPYEVFWGPQGRFDQFLNDPCSLDRPFIHVIKMDSFSPSKNNLKEYIAGMKQQFPGTFESSSRLWGAYRLVSIKVEICEDIQHMAFIQLNETTLMIFRLIYPMQKEYGNGNFPNKQSLDFWETFLKNTETLNQA